MNRNEFNRFVAGIDLPGPGDLDGLRELTALFPWFHSAHLVLLKGLRANSDIRFDSQLKASALSVGDREVLYHYLFLPPAEAAPEPENLAREEVAAPVEEVMAAPEAEVSVAVEETVAPEEASAPVEEVISPVDGEPASAEEVAAPVAETAPDEPDDIRDSVEIPAKDEVALMTEEIEEIMSPEEAEEISAPPEAEGLLVSGETEKSDEGQPEELPVPELSEAEAGVKTGLRTREELIAEIEARLKELESYRQVTVEEQKPVLVDEMVAAVEPAPEHVLSPEPEPEVEETPAPEPAELLELIPDTVAEIETPEKKLSPADLIDRFIMISPTIERMSPKDYQPVRDLTDQGSDEPGKFITETLAKIYINQGYYTRAINIYEKLALQYPEKSAYFASRIEKIKDLIK